LFTFTQLAPTGKYFIDAYSPQKKVRLGAKGISANDASWIQQYVISAISAPDNPLSMWWYGANVDLSTIPTYTKGLSANDASTVQLVAISAQDHYEHDFVPIDDWAYSNDTLLIENDTLVHIRGIMRGDANRDYTGEEKNSQLTKGGRTRERRFDTYGNIELEESERLIDYPILSLSEGEVLAFQLFMPYDADQVELLGLSSPVEGVQLAYNIVGNELLFNWLRMSPVDVKVGDTLAILKFYLKHKAVNRVDRYFRINPTGYEVTRGNVHVDPAWQIALPEIALFYYEDETDTLGFRIDTLGYTPTGSGDDKEIMLKQHGGETEHSGIMSVIPNPMKSWADITYSVYGDCVVSLKLYTLLGEELIVIVDSERQTGLYRRNITSSGLASGVYVLRLETIRGTTVETDVVKVVVQK
ncbi:MAG: T9SS type A sorting domain-containing protein, partial [Bacteroidales bacterium]|nr:T9SS type A sorting domain-containing protein [Bacteroidales bacterium]